VSDRAAASDAMFAEFLGSLEGGAAIPCAAQTAVAQHTLEILACLFAAADIVEMQPVLRIHARPGGRISVPTTAVRSEASLAAGATAALSHAAELDPIHVRTIICPAAVTIPAALALAQMVEISGPRYIAAVCAGYEAAIRLGRALDGARLLSKGWWPTAVCGSFAAAATSAVCLGLTGEQLQHALALGAVHSGGLGIGGPAAPVARNLLCAHTVRVGVDAALAARSGVAGPRGLFSGDRSFLTAFGCRGDAAFIDAGLGESWAILETSLKRWPCALQAQSALDALSVLAGNRAAAATVQAVEIRLPAAMRRIVDRPGAPATRWAAAGSLQFLAAALLLDGDILDSRMEGAGRSEPRLLDLMQRIHVLADSSLEDRYPQEWPAKVMLRDSQGEAATESSLPPGHPARPLSFEASEARFRRYAAPRLSSAKVGSAITFIQTLERQRDIGAVVRLLHPAKRRLHTISAP
jgi:2-methylcitrate dehydratase PrpD